jgi:hypothetical protein
MWRELQRAKEINRVWESRFWFGRSRGKGYFCNPELEAICVHFYDGPVAQLNRAFDYGSKGFRFES